MEDLIVHEFLEILHAKGVKYIPVLPEGEEIVMWIESLGREKYDKLTI